MLRGLAAARKSRAIGIYRNYFTPVVPQLGLTVPAMIVAGFDEDDADAPLQGHHAHLHRLLQCESPLFPGLVRWVLGWRAGPGLGTMRDE